MAVGESCFVCDYVVCSVVPKCACQLFVSEQRSGVGSVAHGFLCSFSVVL